MRVVVAEFLSLDGVMEAPEKWSFPYWNDEIAKFKSDELFASAAHLLGRVTYETFAAAWPSRTGEFADRFNSLPKYVVSKTLENPEWAGTHVIKENVAEEISKLKRQPGRDMLVAGSCTLVQTLMQHGLVDEFHLLVYPLVLGSGKPLFSEGSQASLKLVESKPFGSGVVLLTYQPAASA
ncbi:MAG TPA: dihydrofolate reductase family protein [Thermoanaerobaculia bacterium]|jgi:dihydrofolate reductase|nr:dihydrofolate reductase family protein [Thermoanaerobaculia bacterium]